MNAASRAIAQGGSIPTNFVMLDIINKRNIFAFFLILCVLVSAFSVVYVRDLNRTMFSNLQTMKMEQNNLHVQWGQLLLEQNTWARQARVQYVAQQRLDMVYPSQKSVVMVNL